MPFDYKAREKTPERLAWRRKYQTSEKYRSWRKEYEAKKRAKRKEHEALASKDE